MRSFWRRNMLWFVLFYFFLQKLPFKGLWKLATFHTHDSTVNQCSWNGDGRSKSIHWRCNANAIQFSALLIICASLKEFFLQFWSPRTVKIIVLLMWSTSIELYVWMIIPGNETRPWKLEKTMHFFNPKVNFALITTQRRPLQLNKVISIECLVHKFFICLMITLFIYAWTIIKLLRTPVSSDAQQQTNQQTSIRLTIIACINVACCMVRQTIERFSILFIA